MKQKKQRKLQCLILLGCFMLFLAACGETTKNSIDDLCQSWYKEGNDWASFILYDDGTCELSSKYGTGSWAIVNDNMLKLTDIYGDSTTQEIKSISSECLILLSGSEKQYEDIYWSSSERSLAEAESTAQREEEERKAEEAVAPLEILSMEDYSEGFAWIKYSEKGEKYWCCIDMEGNAIFQYDANLVKDSLIGKFTDGYSQFKTDDGLYTIDTTGTIVAKYPADSGQKVLCYDAGYVVTIEDISGFDAAGYQYTIYGSNGSILKQFANNKELDYNSVNYCGEDVIEFRGIGYFFAKNMNWIDVEYPDETPAFQEGMDMALVGTTYRDEGDIRKGGLQIMTNEGKILNYISDYLSNWAVVPSVINENVCVVYDTWQETIVSIDLSATESYKLDETYSEKLYDNPDPKTFACHNGRIVLRLKGADGNGYICVFDKQLNPVFGPVNASINDYGIYADGLLQMSVEGETGKQDISMYDVNGNQVYSLTELGYEALSTYSCGALLVTDNEKNKLYIDTSGKPLFEEINFKNVETKALS